jgi:hypothetical protein
VGAAAGYVVVGQPTVKRKALCKSKELLRLFGPAKTALPERHRRSHYRHERRRSPGWRRNLVTVTGLFPRGTRADLRVAITSPLTLYL